MFFTLPGRARRRWSGLRLEFPTKTKQISRAGRIRGEPIFVAAAIPGSSHMRRSKAGQKSVRIRRRSRFNSPNGVSNCMASRASRRCSIHFSGSGIPRSPQKGAPSENSSASKSTRAISPKREDVLGSARVSRVHCGVSPQWVLSPRKRDAFTSTRDACATQDAGCCFRSIPEQRISRAAAPDCRARGGLEIIDVMERHCFWRFGANR